MPEFSRRTMLGLITVSGAATAGLLRGGAAWATAGPGSYTPTGIYFHWGVFSVPAYGNEWYPRTMYVSGSNENNHQKAVCGDPSTWPYHNFVNGARDKAGNWVQFAPKLKSAGGNIDPAEWAQRFADAGARFAGRDGFGRRVDVRAAQHRLEPVPRRPERVAGQRHPGDAVGLQRRHQPAVERERRRHDHPCPVGPVPRPERGRHRERHAGDPAGVHGR